MLAILPSYLLMNFKTLELVFVISWPHFGCILNIVSSYRMNDEQCLKNIFFISELQEKQKSIFDDNNVCENANKYASSGGEAMEAK